MQFVLEMRPVNKEIDIVGKKLAYWRVGRGNYKVYINADNWKTRKNKKEKVEDSGLSFSPVPAAPLLPNTNWSHRSICMRKLKKILSKTWLYIN